MPLRVLFTIPNFTTAGSGRALLNITERLDRRIVVPSVAVLKPGGALTQEFEEAGIDVVVEQFCKPEARGAELIRFLLSQRRQLRGRYDWWHSFHWKGDFTEPLLAYAAGARGWSYTKKNMGWGKPWMLRSLLAKRVAVQNRSFLEDHFRGWLLKSRARYIPTGIDIETWQDALPDLSLRLRLGIPDTAKVVGCVSHLLPNKNQLSIVEAISRLNRVHLVLVGAPMDEDYARALRNRAQELGVESRIHFLGAVPRPASLVKSFDVYCLVSFREGSPIAMLESMACGVPGVFSSIPGVVDRIQDGYDGLLVDPDDIDGLATALTRLLNDSQLRRSIGNSANSAAKQWGSIQAEVARYETMFMEVCGEA